VLHRVGNINLFSIDACLGKQSVHQLSGRADKWFSLFVFSVSRLFSNEHDLPMASAAFTKNGLRCITPQVAIAVVFGFFRQLG
jgi:hypothetical protein